MLTTLEIFGVITPNFNPGGEFSFSSRFFSYAHIRPAGRWQLRHKHFAAGPPNLLVLHYDALPRCSGRSGARRRRVTSTQFPETVARELDGSARHQARGRRAKLLLKKFPQHALYGEEGVVGDQASDYQWVVDPLDGTVNYYYKIPHFCVSIALRFKGEVIVGVIYDPMRDELWSGQKGESPHLNGQHFRVSERADLAEAVISVGLSKTGVMIELNVPLLQQMVQRARKCRLMGSAALDMAYVAWGRFDAYIVKGISLWDIAAGWILVESAGGTVDVRPRKDMKDKYSISASNGVIDLKL